MLVLLFTTLLSINSAFYYDETPRTLQQAKDFCKEEYGTTLATITTDQERVKALAEIQGRAAPWIGLEALNPSGQFEFAFPNADPATDCPLGIGDKDCVSFWVNGRPICRSQNGNACALYYPGDEEFPCLYGNGGVNNNCDCVTGTNPTLCDEGSSICGVLQWSCGQRVRWCDARGQRRDLCICDKASDLITRCLDIKNDRCRSFAQCAADSDCTGTDQHCLLNSCCGYGICTSTCDNTIPSRRRMQEELPEEEKGLDCTPVYCPKGPESAHVGHNLNYLNDINGPNVDNFSHYQIYEILSFNVVASLLSSSFVLCIVYWCYLNKTSSKNRSYDVVSEKEEI